jgi:hypothetical protein
LEKISFRGAIFSYIPKQELYPRQIEMLWKMYSKDTVVKQGARLSVIAVL